MHLPTATECAAVAERCAAGRQMTVAGRSPSAHQRPPGRLPREHAAVQVDRLDALLAQVRRRVRRPVAGPADDQGLVGHGQRRRAARRAPSAGCARTPSMWPASHSMSSRTSSTSRPSGSGSGTPATVDGRDLHGIGSLTSAAWTSAGRPAACRRSGRSGSTAGWSRRTTTSRTMSPHTGHFWPARPCTAMLVFFSPLSSLAASPRERSTASPSVVRIAAYSVAARSSVRLLAGLNGDICAACRISSQ